MAGDGKLHFVINLGAISVLKQDFRQVERIREKKSEVVGGDWGAVIHSGKLKGKKNNDRTRAHEAKECAQTSF